MQIAHNFLISNHLGPFGAMGSFDPVSAKYDDARGIWVIIANFEKSGKTRTAEVEITMDGTVLGFEMR